MEEQNKPLHKNMIATGQIINGVLHLGVTVVFKIGDEVNLVNKKFFSA
jgi:hypothetical protein